MRRWWLRRLALFALTVWAVLTASFFLMRAVRGGPFDGERRLDPVVEQSLRARYHLDWPAWKQYLQYVGPLNLDAHGARFLGGDGTRFLGGVLALDLGPSFQHRDFGVDEILAQSLPISLTLGGAALLVALGLGLPCGILAALRRASWLDALLRALALLGLALPNFVIATLLVLVFAVLLRALPVAGWGGIDHLLLPALSLGLPYAGWIARLSRAALLEELALDHVRTARAKGLSEARVVLVHALPGALLPVLAFLGPAAAGILTGSLVVERLFAIPGTGTHFVNGALNRDYTLAMGVTLVYCVLVCALNLLVDLVSRWIDPRLGEKEGAA
jgi:oligopeptide transport system permease protein